MNDNRTSLPLPASRRRWWRIFVAIAIALYFGSYAANSWMGGYWPEPVHDEKRRSADGRWLATAIHWQPAYGYRTLDDSDFLGHFYGPLIACDRVWFHPDKDFLNKTDFLWIIGEAPPEMIHPRHRQAYIESVRPAP